MARTRGYRNTGSSGSASGGGFIDYPQLLSGFIYRAPNAALGTSANSNNQALVAPKYIPNNCTIDRIAAEVTTIGEVGSLERLIIYADDGFFRPGALVLDAGTILGDSATVQSITISQVLSRGWHWFGGASQSAVTLRPTMRAVSTILEPNQFDYGSAGFAGNTTNRCYIGSGLSGAAPALFSSLTSVGASTLAPPSIQIRVV